MNETENREFIYKVVCEWDIGQDYSVFKTANSALGWAVKALTYGGIDDDIDDLMDEGLLYIERVELLP